SISQVGIRSITPFRARPRRSICSAPCFARAPPPLSLSRAELQPLSRSLYQPFIPSQYVSRWRPMRDRCFNIGNALICSSSRSALFRFVFAVCAGKPVPGSVALRGWRVALASALSPGSVPID
ncbi:hypothetical protein PO909_022684, partial [Leuciscus waleckii]